MKLAFVLMILTLTCPKNNLSKLFGSTHNAKVVKAVTQDSLEIAQNVLYLSHPKESDVDNVNRFLIAGFTQSKTQRNREKEYKYRLLLARACIVKDQASKAQDYLLPLINEFSENGKEKAGAKAYLDFAIVYSGNTDAYIEARPFQEDMGPTMLGYLNKALILARKAKDCDLQFKALKQINYYYFYKSNRITGNHHGADSVANVFLNFCKKNAVERLYLPYTILMQISKNDYAFPEALAFGMLAVENGKKFHQDAELVPVYFSLGELYYRTLKYKEALETYENLIATVKRSHSPIPVSIAPAYSDLLYRFKMGAKGLEFLRSFKADTIQSVGLRYFYYLSLASLNEKLENYEDSEKSYLLAHSQLVNQDTLIKLKADLDLGRLYVAWKKYEKARPYVQLMVDPSIKGVPIINLTIAELDLFKIDSAAKNYTSAIRHLVLHNNYLAKYVEQQNHKAVDEIEVKYKTTEKEKNIELLQAKMKIAEEKIKLSHVILLKDQRKVAYLNVQNQLVQSETEKKKKDIALKNQKIRLLTQSNDFQRLSLSKADFEKKMTFGGIALLGIILVLLCYQYITKQKTSKSINQKNIQLQRLVTDKELLMKEVHHRVKNNLHTITSLLETQSSFLDNSIALEAISESQNRIKAIAMIHHRLYLASNLPVIEMQPYIHELVQYLKDCYGTTDRGIICAMQIAAVNLDVQQALPIGLILNEAVTNAIKYAFVGKQTGQISIQLETFSNEDIEFKVKDNGVGLPADLSLKKSSSMGMGLITGLSKQLDGNLDMVSEGEGTVIRVTFKRIRPTEIQLQD